MKKEMTVSAVMENVEVITSLAENEMEMNGCSLELIFQVNIAIDEIFSNIVNYAYPDGAGDVWFSIDFTTSPKAVRLTFEDAGIPYNPLEKEEPDITLSADERQIGGLGIFIVKKTMDEVEYDYKSGHNVLTVIKLIKEEND